MEEEHIDFRKEFEEFKKELENSKPIFDDDSIEFSDFDNLISNSNGLISDSENIVHLIHHDNELNNKYPNISLETDEMLLNLVVKRDYSEIKDLKQRKEAFFNDLKDFIEEFESADESNELMKYYD